MCIKTMKKTTAFDNFKALTETLLRVPHSDVKAKLDAEKHAKKRKKSKKSSASGEAGERA